MIQTPIVNRMRTVVTATNTAILPYLQTVNPLIVQLHYEHGHPAEIINTLVEMNNPQAKQYWKYPLIALFQDFAEDPAKRPGDFKRARPQVIIANQAEPYLKAAERYATNFELILYPIYEEFIRQVRIHFALNYDPGTKLDRPYWGKEGLYGNVANIATDMLDCIEIRNMELPISRTPCVPTSFKNF